MKNVIASPVHRSPACPSAPLHLPRSGFGWTLHVGAGRETKEKMEVSKARAAEYVLDVQPHRSLLLTVALDWTETEPPLYPFFARGISEQDHRATSHILREEKKK